MYCRIVSALSGYPIVHPHMTSAMRGRGVGLIEDNVRKVAWLYQNQMYQNPKNVAKVIWMESFLVASKSILDYVHWYSTHRITQTVVGSTNREEDCDIAKGESERGSPTCISISYAAFLSRSYRSYSEMSRCPDVPMYPGLFVQGDVHMSLCPLCPLSHET